MAIIFLPRSCSGSLKIYASGKMTVLPGIYSGEMEGQILILGLGNLLMGDEGIGDLPEIYLVTINIIEFNEVRIGLLEIITKSLPAVYQTVQKILQ